MIAAPQIVTDASGLFPVDDCPEALGIGLSLEM
jgi:hypothetical protein